MSINLLELAQNALSNPAVLSAASGFLGESESKTSSGIGAAVPALLGGFMSSAKSDGGSALAGLLGKQDAGLLDNIGGLFGGGEASNNALGLGNGILSAVLGNKLGGVVDLIASVSGLGKGSSNNLLSMAAPVVLGLLGKHGGNSASGIANLLGSQGEFLKDAAPAGLASLLGLGGLGSAVSGIAGGVKDAGASAHHAAKSATSHASQYAHDTVEEGGGLLRKLLPFLLLGVLALGAFWLWQSCNKKQHDQTANQVNQTVDSLGNATGQGLDSLGNATGAALDSLGNAVGAVTDSLGNAVGAATDSLGNAIGNAADALGKFFALKLPSGIELNVPENGIENKLNGFIADANKAVDKTTWFNFDRLLFDTGKSTLQPSSQEQLKNIAEILKAYPNVNIKLGGYTDNVGDDQANLRLSAARAATVKAELEKMGIAANRVESEGYGEQHPVASNDTAEGRQQNRRIAVRVTKK